MRTQTLNFTISYFRSFLRTLHVFKRLTTQWLDTVSIFYFMSLRIRLQQLNFTFIIRSSKVFRKDLVTINEDGQVSRVFMGKL